ncbi:hypothetical protein BDD12DRAFT_886388 [Trichophaea hybrida]|nr:hypothetical protein BDD12DRAFT_886388 [Trichophaea hybrida]
MPLPTPIHTLTASQKHDFFSGTIGFSIPPSGHTSRRRQHIPHPLRNPDFLSAILDESTLLSILRFNSSSLHLLGRREIALRLRALERDPEYVLVYLRDRDLVAVLAEFWGCWRDEGARIEIEGVEVKDVVKGVEEALVGTFAARGRKRVVACALRLGV